MNEPYDFEMEEFKNAGPEDFANDPILRVPDYIDDVEVLPKREDPGRLNPAVPRCADTLHEVKTYDVCVRCGEVWWRSD